MAWTVHDYGKIFIRFLVRSCQGLLIGKSKSHQQKRHKDDTGQSAGIHDIRNYFEPVVISSDDEQEQ